MSSASDVLRIDIKKLGERFGTINTDRFSEREQQELYAELQRISGFTVFEGHVEHAYDLAEVADPGRCPRCNAQTEQQYANFIYATQIATRAMFAPAGYFCTECPSVVIDEEIIRCGIGDRRFEFECVLGIDYMGEREPDLFRTWNGKDAVYILDQDERPLGIATPSPVRPYVHASANASKRRQRKKKQRQKMAKQSRRRNRKK